MSEKEKLVRFKENPFLDKLVVRTRNKSVQVNPMGQKQDVYINERTGEIAGTEVRTYKRVDDAEFVKVFTANIALTFDLKSAGIKAFNVLMWVVQKSAIEKDLVVLDSYTLDDFNDFHEKKLSLSTFKRGINELIKAQIIARNVRGGFYYINPNFVFNGNRILFQTIIERRSKNAKYDKHINDLNDVYEDQQEINFKEGEDENE